MNEEFIEFGYAINKVKKMLEEYKMARIYDVISKLEQGNAKPVLKLAEGKEYKINNSKAAVMRIMALNKDDSKTEFERLDDIIKIALGIEAFEFIEKLELTMDKYELIVKAIMAAIEDVDLEEIENRTPRI